MSRTAPTRHRRISAQLARVRAMLPAGGELPADEWRRRHRGLVVFLWLNAGLLLALSVGLRAYGTTHALGHGLAVLPLVAVASMSRFGRRQQSLAVVLGLMTAASLFVHMAHGIIETHFYFFVLVMALTLYEDWQVFLVAVGYVLVHHGVVGTIAPREVFDHAAAWAAPWRWAAIHAAYVAAAGAAGAVAWRLNEDVRARMRGAQHELATISRTDSLTGLGNRRRLMADLQAALDDGAPTVLVLLDLDGFKAYNDTFGHGAGDALLAQFARRLTARLARGATAYRPGGDEFCILAPATADMPASLEALAIDALTERSGVIAVSASSGSVLVGTEARTVNGVLQLADQRMYAQKSAGRTGAGGQAKDVLLATITERSPDLGRHTSGVAELSDAVACELGLRGDELVAVRHAAELHDIGKLAIPDAILDKPGPLSDEEWRFMRRHTLVGERIVSVAPALMRAGELIRASHERIDGTGYPDGLTGDEIPLGARIIAVCDAYEAIIAGRPYRAARSPQEALAELGRNAGTQFDPRVVAAFERTLAAVGTARG